VIPLADIKLDPQRIEEIVVDCLYTDDEDMTAPAPVVVEGILHNMGFHPERLASHKQEIAELLAELPDEFQPADQGGGGGMSFLNMCMDKHGNQWTGLHLRQEQLCLLAIGTGQGQWCLPKEMWSILPGAMPYFAVIKEKQLTDL
jgi:hypothetical protein